MGDNLQWLFGAFGAAWLIHMLYLRSIASRQGKVVKQMDALQDMLANRGENKPS